MAENELNGGMPDAAAAENRPQLMINAQYIKDFSFENPRAPQILVQQKSPPEVSIDVDVQARNLGPDLYEVALSINADAKIEGEAVFIAELTYAGVATIKNASPELLSALVFIETPRILFPFARAIISSATRDGGFPPLLINPIDFAELMRRKQGQAQQGGPATA